MIGDRPLALSTAVVLLAGGPWLATAGAHAPDLAEAPRAKTFTVTASLSKTEILLNEQVVISGTVKPVRDAKVMVQRLDEDGWSTIARRGLKDSGGYRYAFRPQEPGEQTYRVRMPKVGAVRAGASPKLTLDVAEEALVVFKIPAGTGAADWNTAGTTVTARVGDTLRVVNNDTMAHRLHTDGAPFPHPSSDLAPGASEDFVLESAYDSGPQPPLYCHVHGPGSEFWLDVVA